MIKIIKNGTVYAPEYSRKKGYLNRQGYYS